MSILLSFFSSWDYMSLLMLYHFFSSYRCTRRTPQKSHEHYHIYINARGPTRQYTAVLLISFFWGKIIVGVGIISSRSVEKTYLCKYVGQKQQMRWRVITICSISLSLISIIKYLVESENIYQIRCTQRKSFCR